MKRFCLLVLLPFLLMTAGNAQTFYANGVWYQYLDQNQPTELMVIPVPSNYWPSYSGHIVIPSEVTVTQKLSSGKLVNLETPITLPVVKIKRLAFNSTQITSIDIPASVVSIGDDVFKGCNMLTSTKFASVEHLLGIEFLGNNANPLCITKKMPEGWSDDIVVPNTVTYIKPYAFDGCTALKSITIHAGMRLIGKNAFRNCTGLENGKTRFASIASLCNISFDGLYANPLYYAHHLYVGNSTEKATTLNITSDITKIKNNVFAGCKDIIELTISSNLDSIGTDAFRDWTSGLAINYESKDLLTSITCENEYANPLRWASIVKAGGYDVKSITLSSDVKGYAFYGAKWLEEVKIKESVDSIGNDAFRDCVNLKTLTIEGSGLQTIGSNAFRNCWILKNFTIPTSVKKIEEGAFRVCRSLKKVVLPSSVEKLGSYAFAECSSLDTVIIQGPITSISAGTFSTCGKLSLVEFLETVTEIGENAFLNCKSLTALPNGGTIKTIQTSAFKGCTGIASIALPATVTYINSSAFQGTQAKDLIIPELTGELAIAQNAFLDHNLERIFAYPTTAPKADENAFGANTTIKLFCKNVSAYNEEPWSLMTRSEFNNKIIDYYVDNEKKHADTLQVGTDVNPWVPDERAGWKFSGWDTIPKLMPDEDMELHGYYTRQQTINGLTYLLVSKDLEATVLRNDAAYASLTDLKVPSTVTYDKINYNVVAIDARAFNMCEKLQSVEIAASVKRIGNGAFKSCIGLTNINLTPSTGITTLPDSLFYGCYNIKEVKFNDSITTIGSLAFLNCIKLDTLALPAKLDSLGNYAFSKCEKLTKLTLPQTLTRMGAGVFADCKRLENVILNNQLTRLPARTFHGCSRLKNITLPQSVTTIGENAFKACLGITKLEVSGQIKKIEAGAYSGCTNLSTLTIPASVETLGDNAFENCDSLSQITVYCDTPPSATYMTFSSTAYEKSKLYVANPQAYKDKSPWKNFQNIDDFHHRTLSYYIDNDSNAIHVDSLLAGTDVKLWMPEEKPGWIFSGWDQTPKLMPDNDLKLHAYYTRKQTIGGLTYLLVPKDQEATVLPDSAAYASLTDLKVPSTVKYDTINYSVVAIDARAFNKCEKLQSVEIAASVKRIGYSAFKSCTGLTNMIDLTPSTGITTLPDSLFFGCYNIKEVKFHDGITTIGSSVFQNCT